MGDRESKSGSEVLGWSGMFSVMGRKYGVSGESGMFGQGVGDLGP